MTRPSRRVVIAAGLALVTLTAPAERLAGQSPRPTFRASADMVSVDVSVHRRERPIPGLVIEDFEIFDNGVPQAIANLTYGTLPIDLTVALDVSQSVSGFVLDQLRRAVRELAQELADQDRLRVVTFNSRIRRVLDFGAPAAAIAAAFDEIRPAGSTVLLDAIAVALAGPFPPERRQLVVAFSDGQDSLSVTGPEMLIDLAQRTAPTVSVILASPRWQRASATEARAGVYARLAGETGGMVESVAPDESLSSTFRRMLTAFRQSYVLHFVPSGVEPGDFHTLDVRVKRNAVEVRARRGYTWR
jgi:VWFA-related protein